MNSRICVSLPIINQPFMLIDHVKTLLLRDLGKLKQEIEAYRNEQKLWATAGSITNTAGNLCLHLVGNLNTFIGKELGASGYVRNRDLEFSLKDIPRQELVKKIEDTMVVVETSLNKLHPGQLETTFPVVVFDKAVTVEYMLLHLATHLTYHLGQINYHRRLLDQ